MDLFFFLILFFAFFLVGDKIRVLLGLDYSRPGESLVFSSATGLTFVCFITTLLAFAGLIYPITPWVILGFIYLVRTPKILSLARQFIDNLRGFKWRIPSEIPGWFDGFNLMVLWILIFLAITLGLAPAVKTDALVYHLAVPKAYLENHGVIPLPNNIYSFFPMQTEMLYLFCMAMRGEALAKLAGLGIGILLLYALTLYFRQTHSRKLSLFVPVLYFSTLTFFLVVPEAYADLPVAAFTFLTFFAWERWTNDHQTGWFYLMVLFCASALASKLSMMILLPLVFLGIVIAGKKNRTIGILKQTSLLALGIILLLGPWMGRNYAYTGNPFAPFFMQFFQNVGGINWDVERSLQQLHYYKSFGMGHGLTDFLFLPVNLTFFAQPDSLRFDGSIGVVYFLLLPFLFWLNRKTLAMVIVFLTLLVFWFINFQYIRLLTPAFAFLSVLTVSGLFNFIQTREAPGSPPKGKSFNSLILTGLALAILFNLGSILREWNRIQPIPYLLGKESRDHYLTRQIPSYPLFKTINEKLEPDSVILFVYMRNFGYLCDRKFISDTFFEAHTLQKILNQDSSMEGIGSQLKKRGVTHILFDYDYVFGKNTAFPPAQRKTLKEFFNSRTTLVEGKNGYYLYKIVLD